MRGGAKVGATKWACPAELLRAEESSSVSWCTGMLNDVVWASKATQFVFQVAFPRKGGCWQRHTDSQHWVNGNSVESQCEIEACDGQGQPVEETLVSSHGV